MIITFFFCYTRNVREINNDYNHEGKCQVKLKKELKLNGIFPFPT